MDNIISLNEKLKHTEKQRAEIERKQKIMSVRKAFQCASCAARCERCGSPVGYDHNSVKSDFKMPYSFCDICGQEYLEYIEALKGKGDKENYWHNDAWLRVWSTWIEHKGAIDSYIRSKEFEMLLNELNSDQPGSD